MLKRTFFSLSCLPFFVLAWCACGTASRQLAEAAPQRTAVEIPGVNIKAELLSDRVQDGSVIVLNIDLPLGFTSIADLTAEFEGNSVPLFQAADVGDKSAQDKTVRYQALVGIPHNHQPGQAFVKLLFRAATGTKEVQLPFVIEEGGYNSEVLKVDPKFSNPSPRELRRIKRDMAEVGAIYQKVTFQRYWDGPFLFPLDTRITSVYGTKRLFNGEIQSFHNGIDMKAPIGTRIRASGSGRVVLAKDLFFSGKTVLVDHGYGLFTMYCHMSRLKVKKGQMIKAKDVLGLSGMTGRASGPHLHWGVILHKVKINPVELTKLFKS